MPHAITLNALSLPMLALGPLGLLVCWLSLSLEWRRLDERALLGAYRYLALGGAGAAATLFATLNGWLPTADAVRLLLAAVVAVPVILLGFVRGAPAARRPLPAALTGLGVLVWLALAADRGAFVLERGAGPWLPVLFGALLALAALTAFEVMGRLRRDSRARGVALVGLLLGVTTALDAAHLAFGLPVLPVGWVGTLALAASFAALLGGHSRDAYHSLREAQAARDDLEREREDLERKVIHDELTGLYTRAHAVGLLEGILPSRGACVVFIDIDDFKAWNDNFGHAMGDRVLREVAQAIRTSIRFGDVPARYAGDEFIVVLPGVRLDAGRRVAEAIRRKMLEINLGIEGQAAPVTASFGVALGDGSEAPAELLDRADRAVYHAKRGGKNRISSRGASQPRGEALTVEG